MIQLCKEAVAFDAVNHAGLFHSLASGGGAAQAVHANGKEQGSALGGNVQNVADDGIFFNFKSNYNDLLCIFVPLL